jgi:hypothetical protein
MPRLLIFALCLLALVAAGCDIIKQTSLEESVMKALNADPRTKDYKFEVSVQGPGEVMITGTVALAKDIDAVTEVAKQVKGVKQVDNHCKVEEPGSNIMQDETVDAPGIGTL